MCQELFASLGLAQIGCLGGGGHYEENTLDSVIWKTLEPRGTSKIHPEF